jgi:hypothetical protein
MDSTIKLNKEKYRFYIFENESSLTLLGTQETETMEWNRIIELFMNSVNTNKSSSNKEIDSLYHSGLKKLTIEIQSVVDLIQLQLKRIQNDMILEIENDHEGYMIQDILRDRIKQLQLFIIDFRYKLMIHLSTNH